MTREDAIKIFKGFKFLPREMKAVDMAIKALEKEPCEDCVSREKVWYMITGGKYSDEDDEQFIDRLVNKLADLPSVTPQPKTGHWIEEFNDLEGEVRFTCSSCGKYQLFGTDYCCNCGAKMVEPQE